MAASQRQYATGKRKNAIARAWMEPGSGEITINGRELPHYFTLLPHQVRVNAPFQVTNTSGQFRVKATVSGGGVSGQAGAMRHAIAKALVEVNPDFRPSLKKEGFLTRDSRVKERKKYGQKGARARFQYSKR
ncbi:MAG: 30S ribosomal protein S9 [Nitrospirota bacterium]|nr:30S ribosomal protein S9 [Nitrospirota bacterium]